VPAAPLDRPLAAHAAKLVASVPIDLRSTLRQDAGFGRAQLHGRGPRLLEPPHLIQIQFVLRVAKLRDIDGEVRDAVHLTEEHWGDVDPQGLDLVRAQPPKARFGLGPHQYIELPEGQKTALGVLGLHLKPPLITALDITAVKRVSSKHMWVHALGSNCCCWDKVP
jgi:hypothetical protein